GAARVCGSDRDLDAEPGVVAAERVRRAVGSVDRRAGAVAVTAQPGVGERGGGIAPAARIGGQHGADDGVAVDAWLGDDCRGCWEYNARGRGECGVSAAAVRPGNGNP